MLEKLYKINEIFFSIQGEGYYCGTEAIFIRFAGCNLWSGDAEDRPRNKTCGVWCDTDFSSKLVLSEQNLLAILKNMPTPKLIVFTGGEPYLQITQQLIDSVYAMYAGVVRICIETNGTVDKTFDKVWITCSPKSNTEIVLKKCDEIKLVLPQVMSLDFTKFPESDKFFVQPNTSLDNIEHCLKFIKHNPEWKLSLQLHKLLGVR